MCGLWQVFLIVKQTLDIRLIVESRRIAELYAYVLSWNHHQFIVPFFKNIQIKCE